MKVLNKITLESLKRNRARTVVSIIGVILSVAMIAAVTTFIVSLQRYLINGAIRENGDWHIKFLNVDRQFAEEIKLDKEVKSSALLVNTGYALLPGSLNKQKPYLFIQSFTDEALGIMPITLKSGRLPQNASEAVISEHIISNGGAKLKIGDTLNLSIGKRIFNDQPIGQDMSYGATAIDDTTSGETFAPETAASYTIVGICERPGFEPYSAPGYTVITKADPYSDGAMDLLVKLKSPSKAYDFAKKYGKAEGGDQDAQNYVFNRDLLRYYGVSKNDNANAMLYGLGAILISLIMVGGILLIYNSFAISVSERSRQFGVLASIGATKKQLRGSVLFEGCYIGAAGIPFGLLAGVLGIGVTLKVVGAIFNSAVIMDGASLRLRVSAPALIIAACAGMLTILVSAYIPAWRAVRKPPIEIIRQAGDVKIDPKTIGSSKLISPVFGLEAGLAMKNFKRDRKRYRSAVISLFISLALFNSASAFGMYLKKSAEMTIRNLGYDVSFAASQNQTSINDEQLFKLYGQMKNASGVTKSAYWNSLVAYADIRKDMLTSQYLKYYIGNEEELSPSTVIMMPIVFIDDEAYDKYLASLGLSAKDFSISKGKLPAVGVSEGYDIGSQRAISFKTFKDSLIPLSVGNQNWGAEEKKISLEIFDSLPYGFTSHESNGVIIFAPYSDIEKIGAAFESFSGLFMAFSSDDPMKTTAEMKLLAKDADAVAGFTLTNAAEGLAQSRNMLLVINIFTYGFTILISLIASANVFNAISTGISLRKREFAMLQSVGMGPKSFNKMMNFECAFYGIKALLYGLPVSFAIAYLIYKTTLREADVSFTLPWGSVLISIISVFLMVFATMLYATKKIKKANVVDALKAEM